MTLMFMTVPSKNPKPKKCKKRNARKEIYDMAPGLFDFFGDLFNAHENSNKHVDRFPYVTGITEPESKAIIRAKWKENKNEN